MFILSKKDIKFLIKWVLAKKTISLSVMWHVFYKSDFTLTLVLEPSVINHDHAAVTCDFTTALSEGLCCRALLFP